jgi:hypothetical protein
VPREELSAFKIAEEEEAAMFVSPSLLLLCRFLV